MQRYLLQCDPKWNDYQNEMGEYARRPASHAPVIFVDVSLGHWYGRSNWPALRKMMKAHEGEARKGSAGDVWLKRGDNDEVKVQLVNRTNGGVGPMFLHRNKGTTTFVTSYAYSVDPAVLTPGERVCLFADVASKRGYLNKALTHELREFASAKTLIVFGAVFGILFGAEAVAGATAAFVIAQSFGIVTFVADYKFYNQHGRRLQKLAATAETPSQIDEGARILSTLLARLYSDIITNLGIAKISDFVTTLMRRLSSALFGHRAANIDHMNPPPKDDIGDRLLKYNGVVKSYVKHNGYARGDLLQSVKNAENLEPAAMKMFAASSKKNMEAILIRDPGSKRLARITSGVPAVGKPMWLKAKSKNGIDGVICLSDVPKSNVKSAGAVDLSHLRGLSPGLDKVIDSNPRRPAYHFPDEVQAKWEKEIMYDSPAVISGPKMNESLLVEIPVPKPGGGSEKKLLILTKQKDPFIGDTDVASFQRPGASRAGSHRQVKNRAEGQGAEDCVVLEAKMNRSYAKHGGDPKHRPMMHGGAGASVVHVTEAKRAKSDKHWSPRDRKTGKYDQEKLYVFLPVAHGNKIKGECFEFSGWKAAEQFFKANHFQWPF